MKLPEKILKPLSKEFPKNYQEEFLKKLVADFLTKKSDFLNKFPNQNTGEIS